MEYITGDRLVYFCKANILPNIAKRLLKHIQLFFHFIAVAKNKLEEGLGSWGS
jgi:hypothetical protein